MAASLVGGHDVESSFLRVAIGEKAKYCKIKSGWNEDSRATSNSLAHLVLCENFPLTI